MTTPLIKFRELLSKNKFDAILISSVSNIIYLTNYSGFSKEEREAYILIVAQPQGLTHKTPGVLGYILTDARYSQAVKTLIPDFKLIEISPKLSATQALKKLVKKHGIKKIGFEGHNLTHLEHKKLTQALGKISHVDLGSLRTIKNSDEISKIEKACKLGDKTFNYILKKIRLGVSEKKIAQEIEFFIKKNDGDISFPPIVAFGKNSAIPHHVSSDKRLAKSDKLILLDFGVKLDNYCSDMTRTVFFGKASAEFKKMYETVLKAQQKAIECLMQLTSDGGRLSLRSHDSSEVDRIARNYIISKGYPTIPHSLGHGIGIQIHESPHLSPNSKDILKEGMVFSIEPGIYLPASPQGGPNFGGVRIEDLVVLKKTGLRLLTHSPKTIIEL
jgi:Xaa-Pro aminopeptidase